MQKIGIGVLGVGEMGRRHAENIRRLVPGARLAGIADLNLERARQTASELEIDHAFSSLEAMMEQKDIRAVVIATPDKCHATAVIAAAEAGKDIFCEKPLALNVPDAAAALSAVEGAGVRLQAGFMRRYDPAHVAAKMQIEGGEIGEPLIFKSIGRDKEAAPIEAYESQMNGMLFFTNTIHDFDSARWLTNDEVDEVHAFTTVATWPELAGYNDIMASTLNLRFHGGAIGNIESLAKAVYGYDVRTEIVGSKGSIMIGSLRQHSATFLTGSGGSFMTGDYFLARFADAYLAEMRDFADMIIRDGGPRVDGMDGLRAVEIAAAAEQSHRDKVACPVNRVSGKSDRSSESDRDTRQAPSLPAVLSL
jgi:predicted dehydrogenase